MPEISENAALLIAMSHLSLQNARNKSKELYFSYATSCIVFAVFFIEESLSTIIRKKDWTAKLSVTLKDYSGLLSKMVFFINEFPSEYEVITIRDRRYSKEEALERIESVFPGFTELYTYRNSVCHGDLMRKKGSIPNVDDLIKMRQCAKSIVDKLLEVSELSDQRIVNYWEAAKSISIDNGEPKI